MNDITTDYCPKCITGTISKLNRDECMCNRCGTIYGTAHREPQVVKVSGPRPGGNKVARCGV
jgi:hypothetical protein